MGGWRVDANYCRGDCTHAGLILVAFASRPLCFYAQTSRELNAVSAFPLAEVADFIQSPRRRGRLVSTECGLGTATFCAVHGDFPAIPAQRVDCSYARESIQFRTAKQKRGPAREPNPRHKPEQRPPEDKSAIC
jgi:hypothetical protein